MAGFTGAVSVVVGDVKNHIAPLGNPTGSPRPCRYAPKAVTPGADQELIMDIRSHGRQPRRACLGRSPNNHTRESPK